MSRNSSPENVPSAKQGEAVSVAAPGLVGAGGTIPQIYQDWKRDMDVLWEMVMATEKSKQRDALMSGVSALKILLSERGYDA